MANKPKHFSKSVSVNANSDTHLPGVHSDSSELSSMRASSLHRVKNEIQTVLDLMGPSTTSLASHNKNQSEQHEEEEDTSISSSILKETSTSLTTQEDPQVTISSIIEESEHRHYSSKKCCSLHHTPRENGDSHLADFGSSSTLHQIDSMLTQMGCLSPHHEHDGAHMCTNQNCKCMMTGYFNQSFIPMVSQKVCKCVNVAQKHLALSEVRRQKLLEWLKKLKSYDLKLKKPPTLDPCELYRVNISGGDEGDGNRPRRLIFDLVEGIPRPYSNTVGTNTRKEKKKTVSPLRKKVVNRGTIAGNSRNNSFNNFERKRKTASKGNQKNSAMKMENLVYYSNNNNINLEKNVKNQIVEEAEDYKEKKHEEEQKATFYDSNGDTRVDFYYFDHGNAEFLNTTDSQPVMKCEILAEKTEKYTTKFWAEFFASIHIAISFGISFLLQLFKFLLYSIIRPLTVGVMQLGSDYFFKPCLTTLFNGIIQPFLIFLYNIMTTIRDLFDPLAECCGFFLRECGMLCKHIRLCSYKKTENCKCDAEAKCI